MTKSKAAFHLSLQRLAHLRPNPSDRLNVWTFTLPTVQSLMEAKKMWNHLLTLLRPRYLNMCGIRIFELHRSHGLHVHLVTPDWLYVRDVRAISESIGWGRVNVRPFPLAVAGPYLSKKFNRREPCLKGWRLWESVGNWNGTRVKDVFIESAFTRIYRACKEWLGWTGNQDFLHRMRIVNTMLVRTIAEGWSDGYGPGNRPYSDFDYYELLGSR